MFYETKLEKFLLHILGVVMWSSLIILLVILVLKTAVSVMGALCM